MSWQLNPRVLQKTPTRNMARLVSAYSRDVLQTRRPSPVAFALVDRPSNISSANSEVKSTTQKNNSPIPASPTSKSAGTWSVVSLIKRLFGKN